MRYVNNCACTRFVGYLQKRAAAHLYYMKRKIIPSRQCPITISYSWSAPPMIPGTYGWRVRSCSRHVAPSNILVIWIQKKNVICCTWRRFWLFTFFPPRQRCSSAHECADDANLYTIYSVRNDKRTEARRIHFRSKFVRAAINASIQRTWRFLWKQLSRAKRKFRRKHVFAVVNNIIILYVKSKYHSLTNLYRSLYL